jgi:transposase-like protein
MEFIDSVLAGVAEGSVGPESPRAGRAVRRVFSAEYKAAIVAEYDAAPVGDKGAVLRRERLYDSHLQEWRAAQRAGTLSSSARRGRRAKNDSQARITDLERQVKRLQAEVAAKDEVIAARDDALEILGKGVAFLEALSSRTPR